MDMMINGTRIAMSNRTLMTRIMVITYPCIPITRSK
jgi:hypothetical protein